VTFRLPTTYPEPEPLIPEVGPVDLGEVSPVRSFQAFTPSFDEIFDWLWSNYLPYYFDQQAVIRSENNFKRLVKQRKAY